MFHIVSNENSTNNTLHIVSIENLSNNVGLIVLEEKGSK